MYSLNKSKSTSGNCVLSISSFGGIPKIVAKGTKNVTIAQYSFSAQGCDIVVPEIKKLLVEILHQETVLVVIIIEL